MKEFTGKKWDGAHIMKILGSFDLLSSFSSGIRSHDNKKQGIPKGNDLYLFLLPKRG